MRSIAVLRKMVLWPLAALGALMVVVTFTPLVGWWARALAGHWGDPHGSVLIVLGGSVMDEKLVGQSSYLRSIYAMRTYRQGGFREVILSGGGGQPVPAVGPMRQFIECLGVPPEVMRLEDRSMNTRESAVNTVRMLEGVPGRKVLLTSDYHMFRARRLFAKAGLQVEPWPIPDVLKRSQRRSQRWGCFLDLVEESGKIVYYFTKGWI